MSTKILDAARQVFETYGARRATVEDVARAAGISRSTLYRAYPNKDALLQAVLYRELDGFLTELDAVARDLPPQDAIVESFSRGMTLGRKVPLLARLLESEPEVIGGVGATSQASFVLDSATQVATTLRRSGATMPEDELLEVAELLLRLAYTYFLNPSGTLDATNDAAVRAYARRYLAPLVY